MAIEQHQVRVEGIEVTIAVSGEGPPLLALHGAGGSAWRPGYDELAKRFRVYLPEHPGWGTTERPEWLETVQDLAIFHMDLIDELKLAPVNLVGHSMGGWTAAELASLCCHQVRKLVLIDAAGLRIPGEKRVNLFLQNPEQGARTLYYDQTLADRVLAVAPTPEMATITARNRAMTARLAWNPYLCNPALEFRLRRIKVPTLVVWGANDELIPPTHAERYAQLIPGARVAMIAKCGHIPMVEQPQEFGRVIGDFLEE
jgi:pimeloyl-ACP methyl ester carboxylesterase